MLNEETLSHVRDVYKIESECVRDMERYLDAEEFSKAVEILKGARCIGTSGCGHSGIICRHLSHLLCCIELSAKFIDPSEAIHGGMGFLHEGDAIVLASRGGKTKELFPIADICKSKGVKIITVTENEDSHLATIADVVLKQYVNRETDPYNAQGTTSTTSLAVLFHTLQTALIYETGYKNEQFAVIHPGGAVGERLNGRNVQDEK